MNDEESAVIKLTRMNYRMHPSGRAIRLYFHDETRSIAVQMTPEQFAAIVRQLVETVAVMNEASSRGFPPIVTDTVRTELTNTTVLDPKTHL